MPWDVSKILWPVLGSGAAVLVALAILAWFRPDWALAPLRRRPRNVIAWLLSLIIAASYVGNGWWVQGHVTCDFANQWLMGRMIFFQDGHNLYFVGPQCEALASGYSGVDLQKMETDILFKSYDPMNPIEGPLYPPTHALLMYPTSILEPRTAHAVLVLLYGQLVFVAGWLISLITQRRLRTGEATLGILLFPNIPAAFVLGQNSVLTLVIMAAGLALWTRQHPWLAGLVWSLLAFKPVFAATLVLVPLVYGNWRMIVGMALGGGAFASATLPFCGLGSWQRWFMVGRNATDIYANDRNWVWMSRDLVGLPRRVMWDAHSFWEHLKLALHLREPEFPALQEVQNQPIHGLIGAALVAIVVLATLVGGASLVRQRLRQGVPDRWLDDPLMAFTLLGSLLTVFHFMHYDLLPMVVPVLILVSNADRMSWRGCAWLVILWVLLVYSLVEFSVGLGSIRIPIETFLMLATWGWAGWLAWRPWCAGQGDK